MSAVLDIEPAATAQRDAAAMLRAVREIAAGPLADLASDIDRQGVYPRSILQRLGSVGGLSAHLAIDGEADYGAAIQAIAEISRTPR